MGERLLCKQEVIGSIPFTSTTLRWREVVGGNCLEGSEVRSVDETRFVRCSVTSLRGSISLDVEVGVGRHAVRVAWWYDLAGENWSSVDGGCPLHGTESCSDPLDRGLFER